MESIVLRKETYQTYSFKIKQEIINKVLQNGQSLVSVSLDYTLPILKIQCPTFWGQYIKVLVFSFGIK